MLWPTQAWPIPIIMANWRFAPPADSYAKAKAAALKTLELDDRLPEALPILNSE